MKLLSKLFLVAMMAVVMVGCSRNSTEVWEDTKTAGRYAGRSLASLFGRGGDSRQVNSNEEFFARQNEDFIPLEDEEMFQQLNAGNTAGLTGFDSEPAIPAAKESPGDPNSTIPGIDGFTPASSSALAGVFRPLLFPYNSSLLKGKENLEAIKKAARHLKSHPNTFIFVAGHCDERGSAAYNLALGARRANAIRSLLVKEGVNPDQIFTISYGKERPVALGHDENAWRLNRRAAFHLYERGQG